MIRRMKWLGFIRLFFVVSKELHDKIAIEEKIACPKGLGGERKAPKAALKTTIGNEKCMPEGAWGRTESPQKSRIENHDWQ